MPIKTDTTKWVKCKCGKHTKAKFKPATAYVEVTPFQCRCGQDYKIIDYMNGITICHKME